MAQGFATTSQTISTAYPTYPGALIQMAGATFSSQVSTNTESYAELSSSLRISFTPKASTSKLYLRAIIPVNTIGGNIWHFKFYDITNSANVGVGPGTGGRDPVTVSYRGPTADANDCAFVCMEAWVNATNTTAGTYSIYLKKESFEAQTIYINYSNGTAGDYYWDAPSTFTIQEIAQ